MDRLDDFNQPTLRAVARAYCARRRADGLHHPAFVEAMRAYRERYPYAAPTEASSAVQRIITSVTNDPAWFRRSQGDHLKTEREPCPPASI